MARHTSISTPRWQDVISLLLGVWLFVSLWVLAYSGPNATAISERCS